MQAPRVELDRLRGIIGRAFLYQGLPGLSCEARVVCAGLSQDSNGLWRIGQVVLCLPAVRQL